MNPLNEHFIDCWISPMFFNQLCHFFFFSQIFQKKYFKALWTTLRANDQVAQETMNARMMSIIVLCTLISGEDLSLMDGLIDWLVVQT